MSSRVVGEFYERHPYPPVPWLALPRRGEGATLEREPRARILVAGSGTLEALVAAQANPRAREVVALDLSAVSLARLGRRARFARLIGFWGFRARRLPPLRLVAGDLLDESLEPGPFDLVLASNVLHHLEHPALGLRALARRLRVGGELRLVTYPRASRVWMRRTGEYLRSCGLAPETPGLVSRARQEIGKLDAGDPRRSCFRSQPETATAAGVADAFLHPCERPLSPLQWRDAAEACGLRLVDEEQTETSRSTFLDELDPRCASLSPWEKLQILDDTLELCANPVLRLVKEREPDERAELPRPEAWAGAGDDEIGPDDEIAAGAKRADALLRGAGSSLRELLATLEREVGPRVDSREGPLPGLTLTESLPAELRGRESEPDSY